MTGLLICPIVLILTLMKAPRMPLSVIGNRNVRHRFFSYGISLLIDRIFLSYGRNIRKAVFYVNGKLPASIFTLPRSGAETVPGPVKLDI
jgi:hypothetical protein